MRTVGILLLLTLSLPEATLCRSKAHLRKQTNGEEIEVAYSFSLFPRNIEIALPTGEILIGKWRFIRKEDSNWGVLYREVFKNSVALSSARGEIVIEDAKHKIRCEFAGTLHGTAACRDQESMIYTLTF